jgi:electron transfer flavoprotein alpha subunit
VILAWIETHNGSVNPMSWEALGAARQLADAFGLPVAAAVFGQNASAIAAEAGKYGASKVFVCDDATLHADRLEPYAALLSHIVKEQQPKAVVAVATTLGRELLAASAADSDAALLSDAVELKVNGDAVSVIRPVYAGKLLSEVTGAGVTTFVTIRKRAFKAPDASGGAPEVVSVAPVLGEDQIGVKVESFSAESGTVNLSDAAIIVSGGRGVANNPKEAPAGTAAADVWKAKEGFANVLQPLADVLGGAVGASRAAVDAGYIDYAHQVGQTGKSVSPDLYIACAISGAIQHQAGMRTSKVIVAINKDKDAPIFKMARYGLVGDIYQIVPALTKALKAKLGK